MIDRIKFTMDLDRCIDFREYFNQQIAHLEFEFNPIYGNLNYPKYYIHKSRIYGFTLKLFSDKIQFEGSLHKLYNRVRGKIGNHDDFTFNNLLLIVEWLENALEYDAKKHDN